MIKYAEFCTGIGGFRIGISNSKMESMPVYSNEIDNRCELTYYKNFNEKFNSKDIFNLNEENLPDFDMICAGFPCQPFSQAGRGDGFKDPRGTIFFKLMEIIRCKRPDIVFFENVPNLKNHDKGNTFKEIKKQLNDAGYNVYDKIIDSTYFGVPQSRPRIYIVAFSKDRYSNIKFEFTEKLTEKTPLRNFLNLGDYSIPISKRWEEYIDLYTEKKEESDISFTLPKTRKKLERVSSNCNINDCVFQIRSSGIRAYSLDAPFPTFAVSNSGGGAMIPVLSKERRHLNLIEMRRIMGFPESFDLTAVSRTDAIKQLANAVCPPVIESICDDIKRAIDKL